MMAQQTPPRLRPLVDFLLDQIEKLELRLAQSRQDILVLAAEMRHLRATALILLYKAVADAACGRLDAREVQELALSYVVSDPRPVDVVAAALAAARAVLIASYGRKRGQQRCRCADGKHVAAWAVEVINKGVKTSCV